MLTSVKTWVIVIQPRFVALHVQWSEVAWFKRSHSLCFPDVWLSALLELLLTSKWKLNHKLEFLNILSRRHNSYVMVSATALSALAEIKPSLHSRYYTEACNEWRDPSPQLSAWTTQLRRNVAAVASRWRLCVRFGQPGIKPKTFRTYSRVVLRQRAGTAQAHMWNLITGILRLNCKRCSLRAGKTWQICLHDLNFCTYHSQDSYN